MDRAQKQKRRRSGEEMAEHEEEMKEKEEEKEEEEEEEAVDGFSGCRRRLRRARTKENINNRVQMRQWRGRGGGEVAPLETTHGGCARWRLAGWHTRV